MNKTPVIDISVGSSVEYEELVAEITFGNHFGLIIVKKKAEESTR